MSGFAYERPTTLAAALAAVSLPNGRALPIAGGTDLLVWIDEGLATPESVVDVRGVPGMGAVVSRPDSSLRIGAAARIADIAAHAAVRDGFPLLAEACASVGTPALRNMGTIGGNLAQRPRCWYLRRGVACFKNGGSGCAAVGGEHQYHGILDDGTCRAVHPSDPAVALAALGAMVEISSAAGVRMVEVDRLYVGAASNPRAEVALETGELVTAVELPSAAAGGAHFWEKLMQRGAWDFALVSCAAARRVNGEVRLVLGGVGLGPWVLSKSVAEDVASGELDEESIDALAERALYDASPLPGTEYKVTMARALLRRAMRALAET
ncbi:MAG: FAD binding domain-containing protein [Gemmatimonadaceae bacterium]